MLPWVVPHVLIYCSLAFLHFVMEGMELLGVWPEMQLEDIKLALGIPTPPFGIFTCSTFSHSWIYNLLWAKGELLSKTKREKRETYFSFSLCDEKQTTETDKWRARDRGGIETDKWGGNALCCCWVSSQRQSGTVWTLSCLVQSGLCLWVDADVSGLICLHSAVRHPAQTMKQACGPNTLPSCFWLHSVPVRTSCHMTWQVVNEEKGTLELPPPLTVPLEIPAPLGPELSLTSIYTHTC